MKVDKKRFKELKKESGGIAKLECALVIKVKNGFGLQNNKTCNFNIYPNGLYFDFTFGDKIYISMNDIKNIKRVDKIIEIYMNNNEDIELEISKEKDIVKAYNLIVDYAKLMISKIVDTEKIKKEEEWEKYKEDQKRLKELHKQNMDQMRAREQMRESEDNTVRCPKCGSTSITANKKGFSLTKGAAGVLAAGAIGVVAAGHGKNKVIVTCLNCGHQWKAGK